MQLVKLLEALKEPHNLGQYPELQKPLDEAVEIARRLPADKNGDFTRPEMNPVDPAAFFENYKKDLLAEGDKVSAAIFELIGKTARQNEASQRARARKRMPDTKLRPITKALEIKLAALSDALLHEAMLQKHLKDTGEAVAETKYARNEQREEATTALEDIQRKIPISVGTTLDNLILWSKGKKPETTSSEAVELRGMHKKIKGDVLNPDVWDANGPLQTPYVKEDNTPLLMLAIFACHQAYRQIQNLNVALAQGPESQR